MEVVVKQNIYIIIVIIILLYNVIVSFGSAPLISAFITENELKTTH